MLAIIILDSECKEKNKVWEKIIISLKRGGILIKGPSKTIKCKDLEKISILMGIYMLEITKKDFFMDSEYFNIKEIKVSTKVTGIKALNLVMEDVLLAKINKFIKDFGKMISDRVKEGCNSKMVQFTMEISI